MRLTSRRISFNPKHIPRAFIIFTIAGTILLSIRVAVFIKNNHGAASCRRCNVVMLALDSIRASQLPCYGYTRNTMPTLCSFANRNIQFTNAFSQSSWTLPGEASLFTSLYPSNHGMNDSVQDILHPSIKTLPEVYKKAGYETIFIGHSKWNNVPLEAGLADSFDRIISTQDMSLKDQINTWQHAVSALKSRTVKDKPVFLYIYTEYVVDYRTPDSDHAGNFIFDPSFTAPVIPSDGNTENKTGEIDVTEPQHVRYVQNQYDNALLRMDTELSRFLPLFDANPLKQNTILVLFSDHGENLGDHGLLGHITEPFDTVIHVPLIFHLPHIKANTIQTITQLIDLYPTLLSLTGLSVPDAIAGSDISRLFLDESLSPIVDEHMVRLFLNSVNPIQFLHTNALSRALHFS